MHLAERCFVAEHFVLRTSSDPLFEVERRRPNAVNFPAEDPIREETGSGLNGIPAMSIATGRPLPSLLFFVKQNLRKKL